MSRKRFPRAARASLPRKIAGRMNGTERAYADILDIRRAAGEIIAYWYERHTYKLADDLRFTPDFVVMMPDGTLEVHEVKGSFVRDDARAKIKMAAEMFPYRFLMMHKLPKKLGGGWRREEIPSEAWAEAA